MCRNGNQSVNQACYDAIVLQKGGPVSNKVMREILAQHDGCMIDSLALWIDPATWDRAVTVSVELVPPIILPLEIKQKYFGRATVI